jgi:hypothetical protein
MNKLQLKHLPRFPSQVVAGVGIGVEQANGNWTVELDYNNLNIVSPYTPVATDYVLMYNSVNQTYFLVPATSFHI